MDVLIEKYRGHDIIFDPERERFSFEADAGYWSDKQSFAAAKKGIDNYIKKNAEFKPFKIVSVDHRGVRIIQVVGIRKDNRLMIKRGDKIEQLSEYDESNYDIYDEKNGLFYKQIKEYELGTEMIIGERKRELKALHDQISATKLKEYKKSIIVP